jgi:hypothetical protein
MVDYERLSDVLLSYMMGLMGDVKLINKLRGWGYSYDDLIELGFNIEDIDKTYKKGMDNE